MLTRFDVQLSVEIRRCRQDDLPDLEWFGRITPFRETIQTAFRRQMAGDVVMLVADVGGFPIGQVWIDLGRKAEEGVGVLWALRVLAPFQGLGIGTRLLLAAESELGERGFGLAELGVEKENEGARRLYERLGYAVVGEDREPWSYMPPGGVPVEVWEEEWVLRKRLAAAGS